MKPSKTIILVRHGTTQFNEEEKLQGRIDVPLNSRGLSEAQKLAQAMTQQKIDLMIHSPLMRARQTARAIAAGRDIPLQEMDCFKEIDIGEWEGRDFEILRKKEPDFFGKWLSSAAQKIPGGESFVDVCLRVRPGISELLRHPAEFVVIVAHAAVNRAIMGNLLGLEPDISRRFRVRNASCSRLLYFAAETGAYTVMETWNDSSHLELCQ